MKVGVRKPSIKKSVKARTTGKLKRSVKKSINPLYGKKGMGFIKDPERSVKNAIYHRTTVGVKDLYEKGVASTSSETPIYESEPTAAGSGKGIYIFLAILCVMLVLLGLLLALIMPAVGITAAIFGIIGIVYSVKHIKRQTE